MNFIRKYFIENRSIGFFLGLGAAIPLLIIDIVYMIVDGGALKIEDYSKTLAFVMILIGVLIQIGSAFVSQKQINDVMLILSTAAVGIGTGRQMYLTGYPMADAITKVNWFGGNLTIYATFFILFFICNLILIVSTFMRHSKIER